MPFYNLQETSKSKKFNCKIINVFGEFDEYKNF